MIPRLEQEILIGKKGNSIGYIRGGVLIILAADLSKPIPICLFAIQEFGEHFNWVWINDTTTGMLHSMKLSDLEKIPCNDDGDIMITPSQWDKIETEDDYRYQLSSRG